MTAVNICVISPPGFLHADSYGDAATYFDWQFRRLGADVTVCTNKLSKTHTNFVFGAHHGFPANPPSRCVIVNLEQPTADLPVAYWALLSRSHVLHLADLRFGFAPYLDAPRPEPTIDMLFVGSMTSRRRAWFDSFGRDVSTFARPTFGSERDAAIRSARTVVNCHAYEGQSVFERVRAFQVLSVGTEFISEGPPDPVYAPFVTWIGHGGRGDVAAFRQFDPIEDYERILDIA